MTDPTSSDSFDRLTKRIGVIGGLIAALVGVNTLITSCSREQAQRYADFRSAENTEEGAWRALYGDYLATFDKDLSDEARRKRLLAIADLANRDLPTFKEFRLGYFRDDRETKDAAIARIRRMKDGLIKAIGNPDLSDPLVVKVVGQNVSNAEAEADKLRPRAGPGAATAEAAARLAATAAPSVTPIAKTQVLSAGSLNGWDLDLFWCASRDPAVERQNYALALDRARRLGDAATAGRPIAPGVTLGRIRLRVLPTSSQGALPSGLVYPQAGDGLQLRYEDKAPGNRTEFGAAQAIQRLINQAGPPATALVTAGTPTPWYMSMFVCAGAPSAP